MNRSFEQALEHIGDEVDTSNNGNGLGKLLRAPHEIQLTLAAGILKIKSATITSAAPANCIGDMY